MPPVGKTLPIILGFNWSLCDFCVFVKKALVTIANYAITTRAYLSTYLNVPSG